MTKLTLLNDRALGEGVDEAVDGLGFMTYAEVLAEAARNTPGPFTIGVFGEWGTGKTSLMRLTKKQLEGDAGIVAVWFNAWQYERDEHPIVSLVERVLVELKRRRDFLQRLGDKARSLVASLRGVLSGFSFKVPADIAGAEVGWNAGAVIGREEELNADRLLEKSVYGESFDRLAELKLPKGSKIVIFIDDLDRCFPDHAIKLLESIKLVLCQEDFVFVLGVAPNVLESYLRHRYATEFGVSAFRGHTYLEKLVQLPFQIPPHAGRMKSFSAKLLERLDPLFSEQRRGVLPIFELAAGDNPRAMIRAINNVILDVGVSRRLMASGDMNDVPLAMFATTRCVQQLAPEAFRLLIYDDRVCTKVRGWSDGAITKASKEAGDEFHDVAVALVGQTSLMALLRTQAGTAWLDEHMQRREVVQFLKTERAVEMPKKEPLAGPPIYFF